MKKKLCEKIFQKLLLQLINKNIVVTSDKNKVLNNCLEPQKTQICCDFVDKKQELCSVEK